MSIHVCASSHSGPFASDGATSHYPPDQSIAVLHLDLALSLDLAAKRLVGRATVRVRGHGGARSLELDALEFESLTVDGAASSYDGKKLRLVFPSPFAAGEERSFVLDWSVVAPASGLIFSSPSPEAPDASLFVVSDHETERARHWLPCVDHPSSRPTLGFAITADAALTVLANGAFVGETSNADGTKTTRYHLDHPCPSYLTCFAVGDFVRFEGESVDGIPVAAFAPKPFTAAQLALSFGKTSGMLRFFQQKLGVPYPYPKYFQFAATGIGGAMENISLVSWDDRFVLDEDLATEDGALVDVVNVHEMAHAWFGDHVVCRDFAHSWLKESWATYMETVWLESALGKDHSDYDLHANADAYFGESDERYRRPIVTRKFDSSWDLFDMHLYPGGAWRLHMLRRELGDGAFWSGVRDYLVHHGRGTVETDDLRKALEAVSGLSLVRFFDQWIYGPGFPELEVTAAFEADEKRVRIIVTQKQVDATLGVPLFAFPLEVAIDDGTTVRRTTIRVDASRVEAVVAADADPRAIVLDPEYRLLARYDFDPGAPRLLRQLREGADVRLRIDAARRLAKSGKDASLRAIGEALAAEPFYGVRLSVAKALGEAQTAAALDVLLERAAKELEPRVLAATFRALAKYRDPRIVRILLDRLARGLPPRATEAANETLGHQRERAPLDTLLEASRGDGFGGFAAGGALRGLGHSRSRDALAPLLAFVRPGGTSTRARPSAATALGLLAPRLERREREQALEALVDALRDPDPKVRKAAANTLIDVGEPSALGAVRAFAATLTPQDRIRLDRALRTASASNTAALTRAEERIDGLAKQLDTLRQRLETLEATAKKVE